MSIEVWDLLSHSRLRTFISRTTNESLPNSRSLLTFSPCSRWLIAASDSCPVLTVWTVASGELATTIEAETDDGFTALELNPSRLILSAGTLKGIFYQLQLDTKTRERPLQTMRGKISKIAYNSGSFESASRPELILLRWLALPWCCVRRSLRPRCGRQEADWQRPARPLEERG